MKLRVRGNTVRVRLTRSEVARLADGGRVEQTTTFSPKSKLVSSVETSSAKRVTAVFDGVRVAVLLPLEQVHRWAESDDVSIEETQSAGDGESLQILIEKDFQCMHSRTEEQTDAYPNPRKLEC